MGLLCHCGGSLGSVADSRSLGPVIRRRRVCRSCGRKSSTVEVVLGNAPLVVRDPRSPKVESLEVHIATLRSTTLGAINRAFDNLERMRY